MTTDHSIVDKLVDKDPHDVSLLDASEKKGLVQGDSRQAAPEGNSQVSDGDLEDLLKELESHEPSLLRAIFSMC